MRWVLITMVRLEQEQKTKLHITKQKKQEIEIPTRLGLRSPVVQKRKNGPKSAIVPLS